jgi:hypothetical protein
MVINVLEIPIVSKLCSGYLKLAKNISTRLQRAMLPALMGIYSRMDEIKKTSVNHVNLIQELLVGFFEFVNGAFGFREGR